jgi:lipoprotein-releasing system ATP-binding protein
VPHELIAFELSKSYATPSGVLVVLDRLSLRLGTADGPLAILGPSGSGKSTLLSILGCLDQPSSGRSLLDGVDAQAMPAGQVARHRARQIGFVFQDHHLLPQLTALENVLIARMALGAVRGEDRCRADELLAAMDLTNQAGHLPAELSGGQRQRVSVARALMNRPALLLCDEPTGNLDAHMAAQVAELIHQSARSQDALLIITTHSAALAATCARQLHLRDGRLVVEGEAV